MPICPLVVAEISALTDLYVSTNWTSTGMTTGWRDYAKGSDPCQQLWYGVTCNNLGYNHVT